MVRNKCKSRLDDHEGDYNSMKGTDRYLLLLLFLFHYYYYTSYSRKVFLSYT